MEAWAAVGLAGALAFVPMLIFMSATTIIGGVIVLLLALPYPWAAGVLWCALLVAAAMSGAARNRERRAREGERVIIVRRDP